MFPLEGGGGLANQAAHANWRLRLAEFLDGQVAAIRQAAEEAGKIQIQDAEGSQLVVNPGTGQMQLLDKGNGLLLQTDFAAEVMRAIRETGGNAGWATSLEKTIRYAQSLLALKARGTAKFEAFIKAHGSTAIFGTCQGLIARFGPQVISASDFDKAIERFMPEGTARLLRSLEEFTRTVQANQTIFAGLVFEDLGTNLLKPKLNAWANGQQGPVSKALAQRAVANAGYYFQLFTTAGSLAAMAGDTMEGNADKVIKRAAGHLVGLAISAALGSEPAKTELGKMCPGYSWYLLGLEQRQQWAQGDYFEAGKAQFNFELNAVGDLTIAIPVAKGAAAVLRVAGQGGRRVLFQSLRRTGQVITRETIEAQVRRLATKPKLPPAIKADRYAGVTNQRHLSGLHGEELFARWLHETTDEIVIRWGDGVGTHGADIITVNAGSGQNAGRLTIWDTKWRTNPTNIGPSRTFSDAGRLQNALQQAREALEVADGIPSTLRQKAVDSIDSRTFAAHTPGMGAARSSGIQFVHPPPPP